MRNTLVASMALLLVAGSTAGAGMLIDPNDNDHKRVINTWSLQSGASGQYAARFGARANSVSVATTEATGQPRAFLLSATDNDHKMVENGYARR